MRVSATALAVAVHDVEPEAFARVAEIRAWLADRDVARVTLLVIPAWAERPLHADGELARWLRARVAAGDAVAQHGFAHRVSGEAGWPRRILSHWQGAGGAEFPGLDPAAAMTRVARGRGVLAQAGLTPRGFVAPGYAYTQGLRQGLRYSYDWFADLAAIRVRLHRDVQAPALCLGASTRLKRAASPALVRALSYAPGSAMRVDVHPADFDHRLHVATLEWLLDRARGREAVTYDELGR